MGRSRTIRARRQRRHRLRLRVAAAWHALVTAVVLEPMRTPRRYPLGFTPVVLER